MFDYAQVKMSGDQMPKLQGLCSKMHGMFKTMESNTVCSHCHVILEGSATNCDAMIQVNNIIKITNFKV